MEQNERRGALVGGLILVFIGGMALLSQFVETDGGLWGTLIVLGLGLAFLLAGIVTREFGFLIPGGILTGIGAGLALLIGPWQGVFDADGGGLFLIAFAGGWFLITLMGLLVTRQFHWWPLIPGTIIGLVGLAIVFGGALWTILEWLGALWPLALIAAGILVLFKAFRGHTSEPKEKPVEKQA
ncbi:MAG: hypothetical protein R3C44_19325 [Chloroflexota bacterium]